MKLSTSMRHAALCALLHGVPSLAQTVTSAPSATATNDDFMNQLISAGKQLLSSYYPMIATLDTLTLPTSIVIDGATYSIPAIVMQTSSSSSSGAAAAATSTPASTSASQTAAGIVAAATASPTPAASNNGRDRRLGIILGVVLGLLALLLLGLILCLVRRRKKRTGYYLKHEKPLHDEEVNGWRSGHSTRVWSDRDGKYAPVASSAPQMVSKGPALPFAGATYAPVHGDTMPRSYDGLGQTQHTPHHNAAGLATAGAVGGVAGVAAGAATRPRPQSRTDTRSSYHSLSNRHSDIDPVPNPYILSDATHHNDRSHTPLMQDMPSGAVRTKSANSQRSSILRKPIAAPIRTSDLPSETAGVRHGNPFASPADGAPIASDFDRRSRAASPAHPLVHLLHGQDESSYVHDFHDSDYNNDPVPPPGSPERRNSPHFHYPTGPEVNQFDFGLTQQQLRELRNTGDGPYAAAGRTSMGADRQSGDIGRQYGNAGRRSFGAREDQYMNV